MTEVFRPGDLITADIINQILTDIADLRLWIARVEAAQSTGKRVRIIQILPTNTPKSRDIIDVRGENFERPAQRNTVTIGGIAVFQFSDASDEGRLVFQIPPIDVPTGGRNVALVIENTYGKDSVDIRLLPSVSFPKGNLKVNYVTAPILDNDKKIERNGIYYFRFSVQADTDLNGEYELKAEIDSGWGSQPLEVSSETAKTRINIPSMDKQSREFRVKVTVADLAAGSATLKVSAIDATGGNMVTFDTKAIEISIGGNPPSPDSRLQFWVRSLVPPNVTIENGRYIFKDDSPGTVSFYALGQDGKTYDLTVTVKDESNWAVEEPYPSGKATLTFGTPATKKSVNVTLKPTSSAGNTDLVIRVVQTVPADSTPMLFYLPIG